MVTEEELHAIERRWINSPDLEGRRDIDALGSMIGRLNAEIAGLQQVIRQLQSQPPRLMSPDELDMQSATACRCGHIVSATPWHVDKRCPGCGAVTVYGEEL